jgi:hypothetical protein
MSYKKLCIEIIIFIFTLVSFSLSSLFIIYYISSKNYELQTLDKSLKLIKTKNFVINSNEQKIIKTKNYLFQVINDNDKHTNVIFENNFKTENIYVNHNDLIKTIKSTVIIKNDNDKPLNITIKYYN